jgi:YidC/Oxa1 family membrane protein insertase
MAKTLISSPSFLGTPLPSLHRKFSPNRTRLFTKVHFSFHELPPIQSINHSIDLSGVFARAEGLLYTLADATVAADAAVSTDVTTVQKNGGWFGFISDAMEFVLKVIFTTCAL